MTAHPIAITVGSTAEYQWSVPLSFPSPGTYCYRVQLAGVDLLGTDPSPQVSTAAAPGAPFSFAVLGDYGAGTTAEAAVMSRIGASPASFVVTAGDNVYNSGTETEYGDLSQGNLFPSQYLPALGGKPIFASEGNHGFSINTPYVQDFAAPLAAAASGGSDVSESYCCISTLSGAHTYPSVWYAYNWGSARFYVLDGAWADTQGAYQGDFLGHWNGPVSGCGPCGAELTWLKSDLAAHASTPIKFAFFHYPLHADSSGQGTDTYLDGPTGLEGLLANNNVQIAFNGHAHQYERNYPQIPGKPLVTYVDGNGGDALGSVGGCSAFDAYAIGSGSSCHAPTPASDANVYGFVLVTVNGSQVTVTPTDSTGRTFDVQTYNYSSAPTTSVLIPSAGATLSGTAATLDAAASNATSVQFLLSGGAYSNQVICTTTPTIYGWVCPWDSTTVPNGTYTLNSKAFNSTANAVSTGVAVTVANSPPPTTSVLIPSAGATLSGTAATLDAAASNATSVQFLLSGGAYSNQVICTTTPTIYGWICPWDSTRVPNGTYTLNSKAFNSTANAVSTGVAVTVANSPPPTTSVVIPSAGATLSGTAALLDAAASNATSVQFLLSGGGYSGLVVGTATATIYGWIVVWNTTAVPNNSYVLSSEAFGPGGNAFSGSVSITVHN